MTQGMKSSELWVSILAAGVGGYLALKGIGLEVILGVVSPLVTYTLSRGIAKHGTNGAAVK